MAGFGLVKGLVILLVHKPQTKVYTNTFCNQDIQPSLFHLCMACRHYKLQTDYLLTYSTYVYTRVFDNSPPHTATALYVILC